MIAGVLFVPVGNVQARHRLVQLPVRLQQIILCAHIQPDGVVLLEIGRVVVQHLERSVGGPPGDHLRAHHPVPERQVGEERRIRRIR